MARFTFFPENDPKQTLRIRRTFMAYGFYLLAYLILLFAICQELMELRIYLWFVLITTLTHVVYYLICRSGLNLKLHDPSMTLLQMHVALVNIIVMMYFCDEVRWAFMLMFLVVFLFGIFRLHIWEFLCTVLFAMAGYAVMIGLLVRNKPQINFRHELFEWLVLAGILPFFSLLVGHINTMRRKLKESMLIIRQMATHDELTGVQNRRSLMAALEREKGRTDRDGETFCVCMLDLDHFKGINDTLGHVGGDRVLVNFARLVSEGLRGTDYLARYGGEEFVLVLPGTSLLGAVTVAEQLRGRVATEEFPEFGPAFRITVSIGIAEYTSEEDVAQTIDRADQALYMAKRKGRNRVEHIDSREMAPLSAVGCG